MSQVTLFFEDNASGGDEDVTDVARIDLLILMIMNGNDYLPKVRGSGFVSFFKAYKQVPKP